ncbi:MAG: M20/M25/M40 family metallo-hydrolase [Bacteroidota bacterium]
MTNCLIIKLLDKILFSALFLVFVLISPSNIYSSELTVKSKKKDYRTPEIILSEYIQHASVTGLEKEAGEFMSNLCLDMGLHVKVFTDEINSYNYAASLYPLETKKPNIVFLNHIDVVPAENLSAWKYPPFEGVIAEGQVWGRGAIDNKGMAIMQLFAIANFVDMAKAVDLPYNVTYLSVSSEETGGLLGASIVVTNFLDELNPIVVYGEGPSGIVGAVKSKEDFPFFGISIAQKRGLWFALEASNMYSGHGSLPRPQYPNKEIVRASTELLEARPQIILTDPVRDMMRQLGKYEKGRRKFVLRNIGIFAPFFSKTLRSDLLLSAMISNTMTLTNLSSAPGSNNQVSNNAKAIFDCRLLPETSTDRFLNFVKNKIKDYDVTLTVIHEYPNAPVSEKGEFYQALSTAIKNINGNVGVAPLLFPANNDNAYFRMHDIPSYGVFPAILSQELMETIHMANERMPVKGLYEGIKVYSELINIIMDAEEYSGFLKEKLSSEDK